MLCILRLVFTLVVSLRMRLWSCLNKSLFCLCFNKVRNLFVCVVLSSPRVASLTTESLASPLGSVFRTGLALSSRRVVPLGLACDTGVARRVVRVCAVTSLYWRCASFYSFIVATSRQWSSGDVQPSAIIHTHTALRSLLTETKAFETT